VSITYTQKYAMTRMDTGVYLIPSNDGQTLWRISAYQEDGSAGDYGPNGEWVGIHGRFWMTAKRPMPTQAEIDAAVDEYDFLWGDRWEEWAMGFRTRRDALEDALR
jgi:hypothetical protein